MAEHRTREKYIIAQFIAYPDINTPVPNPSSQTRSLISIPAQERSSVSEGDIAHF